MLEDDGLIISHQSSEFSRLKLCTSASSGLENGHGSAGSERFFLCPKLPGDSSSKWPIKHHTTHRFSLMLRLNQAENSVCVYVGVCVWVAVH